MSIRSLAFIAICAGLQLGCVPEISPPGATPDDTGPGGVGAIDADGDGYDSSEDCDDTDSAIFPGATEICDDIDNDCDDEIDEDAPTLYADDDGDGFGDPDGETTTACEAEGFSPYGVDCDDTDDTIHPGVEDFCDGVDNDCDDLIDEDEAATVSQQDTEADYASINDALDAGESCISVGPGTYYEALTLTSDTILTSSDGPESTIINGSDDYGSSIIYASNNLTNNTIISGFTLEEGSGYISSGESTNYDYEQAYGGGIYVSYSTPVLRNLVIQNNQLLEYYYDGDLYQTSTGGGIYMFSYSATGESAILEDIEFSNNSANSASDLYVYGQSGMEARRIWSHDSSSSGSGSAFYFVYFYGDDQALLENVIIDSFAAASPSGNGVIYTYGSNLDASNIAVVDSQAYAALYNYQYNVTYDIEVNLRNSVLAYNDVDYAVYTIDGDTDAEVNISYCALTEPSTIYATSGTNALGSTNLTDEDPQFTSFSQDQDGSNNKLTLSSDSPLIDAGDPSRSYEDLDGSTNDIGPYGGPEATW